VLHHPSATGRLVRWTRACASIPPWSSHRCGARLPPLCRALPRSAYSVPKRSEYLSVESVRRTPANTFVCAQILYGPHRQRHPRAGPLGSSSVAWPRVKARVSSVTCAVSAFDDDDMTCRRRIFVIVESFDFSRDCVLLASSPESARGKKPDDHRWRKIFWFAVYFIGGITCKVAVCL